MMLASRLTATVLKLIVAAVAICVAAEPSFAFSVQPTQVEMISAGQRARSQVTVTNDGPAAMPVELTVESLSIDEKGTSRTSAGGDSFLIFPPQALIAPGASQVFRLQWVGEPQMAKSESFMVSVNQIPVASPKGRSTVQIVMSMGVVVNIAPAEGHADLKIVDAAVAMDKGKRHVALTVENPSNVHALLPDARIKLSSGTWSATLGRGELGNTIGLVQPGKKRRFILPVDVPPGVQSIQASIEYSPTRK
jgi:fimbrial chaperone protein